jgi:L-histidine N-alpha-methyltransferase
MSSLATAPEITSAVASEAILGLTASPKTLTPWLFYDEAGSHLFEQITTLPEYYLTRTERGILAAHADEILIQAAGDARLTLVELGAGTATKTGLLLAAAVRRQHTVVYQPVDVSETALDEARENIEANIAGVTVQSQVADYTSEPLRLQHQHGTRTLALYIGSSIGNFAPGDATEVLRNLRAQLQPGDSLLLGTDLAKDEATLLAAYNDAAGTTAAFNLNILTRLNRELGANFRIESFTHKAIWNAPESRIEMHLESTISQSVHIPASGDTPASNISFSAGETIHTENSYKFTASAIASLMHDAGFVPKRTWHDLQDLFAVTLACTT